MSVSPVSSDPTISVNDPVPAHTCAVSGRSPASPRSNHVPPSGAPIAIGGPPKSSAPLNSSDQPVTTPRYPYALSETHSVQSPSALCPTKELSPDAARGGSGSASP